MSGIAAYMALNSLPNQISQHQLDEATQLFVKAIPDDVSLSVGAAADEIRHPLKRNHAERYDWEGHTAEALAHIKTDVRVCGILVTDSSKDGTFKFAHKSFLEFLQAQLASDLCKSEPLLQARALSIMRALGLRIDGLVSSLEVALFFGELLRERFRTTDTKADDHALSALLFNSLVISNVNPPKWITFLIGFQFHFQSIVLLLMVRMGLGPKRLLSTLMMRQRAVIVMAFGVTISAVPLILSLLGISHSLTLAIAGMASFTLASFALGGIFFMGSSRIAVNRTQIWLQVCRKLKIPSKTIARQVGPYFVQVFDHDGSTKLDPFTEIGSVRAKD